MICREGRGKRMICREGEGKRDDLQGGRREEGGFLEREEGIRTIC